ncbi:AIR synthase-related protein, partial [Pseudomonas syringae group genomosp. 7]|uniref:AIR synthase-related protein n=1 Tax=Pseudomonas syringae group genomosp. 7 TaxID=251699 RepID=UPI00376FADE7
EVIDRCRQLGQRKPSSFIHDVAAGGLSNAIPELVNEGDRGGRFQQRNVPNDEPGKPPLQISSKESKDRNQQPVGLYDFPR